MGEEFGQRRNADDVDAGDKGGLGKVFGGEKDGLKMGGFCGLQNVDYAFYGPNFAV